MDLAKNVVAWLEQRKQNAGIMSDLRRSLRDETHSQAWPYISAFCNISRSSEELLNRVFFGLYGMHPEHSDNIGNFGESIKRLAILRGGDFDLHEKYLKRFTSALDIVEVLERLPFVIKMMKSVGVPVNYVQLYTDLYWWGRANDDRERVQRNWCKGYYYEKEKKCS